MARCQTKTQCDHSLITVTVVVMENTGVRVRERTHRQKKFDYTILSEPTEYPLQHHSASLSLGQPGSELTGSVRATNHRLIILLEQL